MRGANVFPGYLNRPDATAKVIDDEGWFYTGDIGSVDADRFHPGMSFDFLTQLGGLITEALRRY